MKLCFIVNCKEKFHAKKRCIKHYRKWRQKLNPKKQWEYEKTFNGFIMRIYRNMLSRVTGIQTAKLHLYKGKYLLSKKSFYIWAKEHPIFKELFANYTANGYNIKLAPSVDRINPDDGYRLKNMQWVTHSENSRRSSITKKRLKK